MGLAANGGTALPDASFSARGPGGQEEGGSRGQPFRIRMNCFAPGAALVTVRLPFDDDTYEDAVFAFTKLHSHSSRPVAHRRARNKERVHGACWGACLRGHSRAAHMRPRNRLVTLLKVAGVLMSVCGLCVGGACVARFVQQRDGGGKGSHAQRHPRSPSRRSAPVYEYEYGQAPRSPNTVGRGLMSSASER